MKKLLRVIPALFLAATSLLLAAGYLPAAEAGRGTVRGAPALGAPAGGPAACTDSITNGGFESGVTGWQVTTNGPGPLVGGARPHTGAASAVLGGRNNGQDELEQEISLPAGQAATFRFWRHIVTQETLHPFDTLEVSVKLKGQETVLITLTDGSPGGVWQEAVFDLSSYAGETPSLKFVARTSDARPTTFYLDDVSVLACAGGMATLTPTASPTQTVTPAVTPTSSVTHTATPTGSVTPEPSETPSPTGTPTATPTGGAHARHTITFPAGGFRYSPADLSIAVGDEVEWQGPFASHPLVSEKGLWPVVTSGDSFRFVFTQPGLYRYYCQVHGGPGGAGMSGIVRVGLARRIYLPLVVR